MLRLPIPVKSHSMFRASGPEIFLCRYSGDHRASKIVCFIHRRDHNATSRNKYQNCVIFLSKKGNVLDRGNFNIWPITRLEWDRHDCSNMYACANFFFGSNLHQRIAIAIHGFEIALDRPKCRIPDIYSHSRWFHERYEHRTTARQHRYNRTMVGFCFRLLPSRQANLASDGFPRVPCGKRNFNRDMGGRANTPYNPSRVRQPTYFLS